MPPPRFQNLFVYFPVSIGHQAILEVGFMRGKEGVMSLDQLRNRFRWPALYISLYDMCRYQGDRDSRYSCVTSECPYFVKTADNYSRICVLSLKDGDIDGYPSRYTHEELI